MSEAYPARPYRRVSKRRLQQGDIAITEFHQLRARSGEAIGPGPPEVSSDRLPYFGDFTDHRVLVPVGGREEERVLRIWTGPVIIVHQNCEIDLSDENDTRLQIAPVVTRPQWPEGSWIAMSENLIPGFFYLPAMSEEGFKELGLTFSGGWPESVVSFAGTTLSSVGLIKPRREFSIAPDMLPIFQENLVRFDSTRGFADLPALQGMLGKRIVSVKETGVNVRGPSSIVKVYLGENEDEVDDLDDEASITYFGMRPV